MIVGIFESLVYNAALLLALAITYDVIITRKFDSRIMVKIYTGLIIAAIGLGVMLHPWVLQEGIVFDARTILFSITAMFFGPIPAIISGLIAIIFRISMGGVGILVGSCTIISAILWGLFWRYLHERRESPYGFMEFYQLGVLNHISMILLMFLLPDELKWRVIQGVSIPVLLIYPLVTVLLGKILAHRILREQEQQALLKSEHKYRLLAETTRDMIILHDVEGNIIYANQMAHNFFGIRSLKEEKIELKPFILPEYHQSLEDIVADLKRGISDVKMYQIKVWNAERQVRTLEVNSAMISGKDQDTQMLAAGRDITERIQAVEQKKRYASLLEVLRELDRIVLESLSFEEVCNEAMKKLQELIPFKILMMIRIYDQSVRILALRKPELRHRYLNTRDHFPHNKEFGAMLLSKQHYVVSDTSTLTEEKDMRIRAALVKEGMQSFMYNAVIVQNELMGFLWFCSDKKNAFAAQHIEEGEEFANQLAIVLHQMGLIQQIKDKAQDMEAQVDLSTDHLKHSMQELEAFSYLAAHDLQVPLNTIRDYAKALQEGFEVHPQPEGREILLAMKAEAAGMNRVISEILSLVRRNAKEIQMHRLDMKAMVQRQLKHVPEDFSVKVDPLLPCRGDATLIELVWKNLIENAVKFSIPAGLHEIHIGSELKDDEVVYFVKDSGVGFDPAQKDSLFEPFHKLHDYKEFDGDGVGLALTKKIILHHEGALWADSRVGEGSSFYYSLPCAPEDIHPQGDRP